MQSDLINEALASMDLLNEQLAKVKQTLHALMKKDPPKAKTRIPQNPVALPKYTTASTLTAEKLGPTPNIEDPNWPLAVPAHMLVNNEDPMVKQFRAIQVTGIVGIPTSGLKILDFGCGDGFVSKELTGNAGQVYGYDIRANLLWPNHRADNLILTTDWSMITANAPYDLIIGFDTFDHLENMDLDEAMASLADVLSPSGRAFFRFHPWTAKHGSHLYDKCNKAYVHLALTPDELGMHKIFADYNVKVNRPFATYDSLFVKNGLSIIKRKGHTDNVDPFFDDDLVERINKITYRGKADKDSIRKIMALQFIDYTVKKV